MKTLLAIIILIIFSIEIYSNPAVIPVRETHHVFLVIEAGTTNNILRISDSPFEIENNIGYNIGLNGAIYPGRSVDNVIGLSFNLNYLSRRHSYTNNIDNVSGDITYNTLQSKLNFIYKIIEFNHFNISALGGPVFGYLFDSKATNESGILLENDQPLEILLNLGLKIEKQIHGRFIGIEYNYQTGLTNMNQNFGGITNNTHNLMLSYRTYL